MWLFFRIWEVLMKILAVNRIELINWIYWLNILIFWVLIIRHCRQFIVCLILSVRRGWSLWKRKTLQRVIRKISFCFGLILIYWGNCLFRSFWMIFIKSIGNWMEIRRLISLLIWIFIVLFCLIVLELWRENELIKNVF